MIKLVSNFFWKNSCYAFISKPFSTETWFLDSTFGAIRTFYISFCIKFSLLVQNLRQCKVLDLKWVDLTYCWLSCIRKDLFPIKLPVYFLHHVVFIPGKGGLIIPLCVSPHSCLVTILTQYKYNLVMSILESLVKL